MYIPSQFAWTAPDSLLAFCRAHSFATVVADGANGVEAQHLPLLVDQVDGRMALRGHVALGNPLRCAERALAIFSGPHAYVSAALYGEDDMVPTWNYLAVHASGPLRLISDPGEVRACFAALADGDPARQAWQARLSEAAYAQLAAAMRWFAIDVEHCAGKAKLSQDHPPEQRARVIDGLRASPDPVSRATAEAMARMLTGGPPWPPASP